MKVRCLFFAAFREALGVDELELVLPAGSTVADAVARVRDRAGGTALPRSLAVAVNQEYASADVGLSEGDELAFIPPVAGG